ncbi:hypothetical protein Hypma_000630 [Hypsizygus marmoreus]|uniref:Uncharacterized protein n=1 Tax=Hypsizygus marmoreus TaxID=39966 RepID=A0A369J9V3_HYPMA|nr:hypothetical protein Hypma_000630 [Hypsizygus marmoreus]
MATLSTTCIYTSQTYLVPETASAHAADTFMVGIGTSTREYLEKDLNLFVIDVRPSKALLLKSRQYTAIEDPFAESLCSK